MRIRSVWIIKTRWLARLISIDMISKGIWYSWIRVHVINKINTTLYLFVNIFFYKHMHAYSTGNHEYYTYCSTGIRIVLHCTVLLHCIVQYTVYIHTYIHTHQCQRLAAAVWRSWRQFLAMKSWALVVVVVAGYACIQSSWVYCNGNGLQVSLRSFHTQL